MKAALPITANDPAMSMGYPGYFDLRSLAVYSSCSVRWLRNRLVDKFCPLPHHRVEGKLLVKREDFHEWMEHFRSAKASSDVNALVDDVVSEILRK